MLRVLGANADSLSFGLYGSQMCLMNGAPASSLLQQERQQGMVRAHAVYCNTALVHTQARMVVALHDVLRLRLALTAVSLIAVGASESSIHGPNEWRARSRLY